MKKVLLLTAILSLFYISCNEEEPVVPGLAKSKLTVITEPPGASIYINGERAENRSPIIIDDIDPGFHNLELTLNKYLDTSFYFIIERFVNDTVHIELREDPVIWWEFYNSDNSPLLTNLINCIAIDETDRIWLGTESFGIIRFDGTNWDEINISNSTIPSNRVRDILYKTPDEIWIATNTGASMYNGSEWITYNENNSDIASNNTSTVYIDSKNRVWIGTRGHGVSVYDRIEFTTYNSRNSGLFVENVRSISEDGSGNILIGTDVGGLFVITEGEWESIRTTNSSLPSDVIAELYLSKSNELWVGSGSATNAGGISVLDNQRTFVKQFSAAEISGTYAIDITEDSFGNYWVATIRGGLAVYDGNSWDNYTPMESGLPSENVLGVVVDSKDNKWIICEGIAKYTGNKN